MAGAVRQHGAARGSWLGLKRLARCRPFGGYGVDPVPDELPGAWWAGAARKVR
jgi:putative component of membrane protein insertase Oxa1/YidC/SpoIIIJ protein YidD